MKLSISNIAWKQEQDEMVYVMLKKYGFTGLEIAPSRWFPKAPYEHIQEAKQEHLRLLKKYGLNISSIQSIWYGRTENIWKSCEERRTLLKYTEKAIDFAAEVKCGNLVFGCPKNRNRPENMEDIEILSFLGALGKYAEIHHTAVAIEANPPIYHTNYINTTMEAVELVKMVGCFGVRLNLDLGTMIENKESIDGLAEYLEYVNHVHISEPYLMPIKQRKMHRDLSDILRQYDYQGYISIEMSSQDEMSLLDEAMAYVAEVFG